MTPGVSVVIPTHNTRALTRRCLETLNAAIYDRPVEIVVVDDGSSDGTTEAVKAACPAARVLRHDTARGFSAAANAGLRAATGEWMLLLNSDTEVPPDGLAALATAFARDRTLGVAGAQLWYPNGDPQWSGGPEPGPAWLFLQASGASSWLGSLPGYRRARPLSHAGERDVDWVAGAALAMRREVWERIGPFDEGFHVYAQDLDFCLRAHAAGWRVAVIGPCRVMHHRGATIDALPGATLGENPEAMWRDLARWADRTHGPAFARRAMRALRWGAALRVLGRQAATPFLAADRRETWRRNTATIRHAILVLSTRR